MLVTTKAIVISTLKYGDTSLIAKCFTLSSGMKTYLLKGVLASKKGKIKAAYFQPLTLLDIIARHKDKGNMESLKDVKVNYPYQSLHMDIRKNAIAFFLSEVINNSIGEEEENPALFQYLETAFKWLDTHEKIANFHIVFLINLTKYIGFYPDDSNKNLPFFDLSEGAFTEYASRDTISDENLTHFKSFLGINFDDIDEVKLFKKQRQSLLEVIITYFELHLHGFKKPKSLIVLNEVFNL